MLAEALVETPLAPPADLGPYRHRDYVQRPDEPRCELLYGRFYVSPSPNLLHQIVALYLWQHLESLAVEHGGIAVAAPMDVVLADHSVVQPDVLYLSAQRRHLGQERIEGAPDLVVEVLSAGGSRRDRGEKLKLYAESGVLEYWIVEPFERQIEFLIADRGGFRVALPEGEVYRSSRVSEIELNVGTFWQGVAARMGS